MSKSNNNQKPTGTPKNIPFQRVERPENKGQVPRMQNPPPPPPKK